MPKAKKDYTLRQLRSECNKANKRLSDYEDALQLAMGDMEAGTAKEIPAFLIESVMHYRKEVSNIRDKILKEEEKLEKLEKIEKTEKR